MPCAAAAPRSCAQSAPAGGRAAAAAVAGGCEAVVRRRRLAAALNSRAARAVSSAHTRDSSLAMSVRAGGRRGWVCRREAKRFAVGPGLGWRAGEPARIEKTSGRRASRQHKKRGEPSPLHCAAPPATSHRPLIPHMPSSCQLARFTTPRRHLIRRSAHTAQCAAHGTRPATLRAAPASPNTPAAPRPPRSAARPAARAPVPVTQS